MDKYEGKDNSGKPKTEYLETLKLMSEETLIRETKDKIWLSAYANNNPRSDYHWHVDACYDELKTRTGKTDLYSMCYKNVVNGV